MTIQKPADQSIIFSGAMVRSLIVGRKTETRRLAWDAKSHREFHAITDTMIDQYTQQGLRVRQVGNKYEVDKPTRWQSLKPGTQLWVRENWAVELNDDGCPCDPPIILYAATDKWEGRTMPSIHMPRKYSRLTLVVQKTYVEPLQNISIASCLAEGCRTAPADIYCPHEWFRDLWNSINDSHPWSSNPEVAVVVFSVEQRNIDAKESA